MAHEAVCRTGTGRAPQLHGLQNDRRWQAGKCDRSNGSISGATGPMTPSRTRLRARSLTRDPCAMHVADVDYFDETYFSRRI